MTSKCVRFSLAVFVLSVVALAQTSTAAAKPAPSPAADAPDASTTAPATATLRIGIISMQTAIAASNEGRRDFEALSKKFEPKQAELKGMNDEVEGLKRQLNTQGDKLNDESRSGLVKTIEQKQKSLQRSLEDAQSDFQAQQNEILNRIGGKMMDVLDKYAKANGYALILDVSNQNSPVLWAGASTDVTKAIVEQYNQVSGVAPPPAGAGTRAPSVGTRPGITGKPPVRPSTTTPTKPQ